MKATERLARLTERELHVLAQVVAGRTSREIAALYGISERTVELHRFRLSKKLDTYGRFNLTRLMEKAATEGKS